MQIELIGTTQPSSLLCHKKLLHRENFISCGLCMKATYKLFGLLKESSEIYCCKCPRYSVGHENHYRF